MPPHPRPEIESLVPTPHGGYHADEWNARGTVIDFSSNVNPFGVSPRVRDALHHAIIERHPDPDAGELRDVLATRWRLPHECVIVGNGSLDLIRALAIAYIRSGDTALVIGPTFGEYRVAAELMGAHVETCTALAQDDFHLDVQSAAAQVSERHPRLAFICNPNNPTGACLARDQIVQLLSASSETLWVLDEAFIAFVDQAWSSLDLLARFENLVVMRSMTKDYAIPGLRLGYALADRDIIAALNKVRAPWSVNVMAQAAGIAALNDDAFLCATLDKIRSASSELRASITRLGWRVVPSTTHFFLVDVGDARTFRATLASGGIIVRDCTSFGLPEYIRIAPRAPGENARLIALLQDRLEHDEIDPSSSL